VLPKDESKQQQQKTTCLRTDWSSSSPRVRCQLDYVLGQGEEVMQFELSLKLRFKTRLNCNNQNLLELYNV
jgi:hypothetical protein